MLSGKEGQQVGDSPISVGNRPILLPRMPPATSDGLDLHHALGGIRQEHNESSRFPWPDLNRAPHSPDRQMRSLELYCPRCGFRRLSHESPQMDCRSITVNPGAKIHRVSRIEQISLKLMSWEKTWPGVTPIKVDQPVLG